LNISILPFILDDLIAANPGITNPALIYHGMVNHAAPLMVIKNITENGGLLNIINRKKIDIVAKDISVL